MVSAKRSPGRAVIPEKQNRAFKDVHGLFLGGEDLTQRPAMGYFLSPAASDIDLEAIGTLLHGIKMTFATAATAMDTDLRIDMELLIHDPGRAMGQTASMAHFLQPLQAASSKFGTL